MNRSGPVCLHLFAKFYGIHPESILIAHDELDIPVGSIETKTRVVVVGHNEA